MRKCILITTDNSGGDKQIDDWKDQEIAAVQSIGDEDKSSFVRKDTDPKFTDNNRGARVLPETWYKQKEISSLSQEELYILRVKIKRPYPICINLNNMCITDFLKKFNFNDQKDHSQRKITLLSLNKSQMPRFF